MRITIETIEHKEQRYPTVGDWFWDERGDLTVRVSRLSDWRREALIGLHEAIEAVLCRHENVTTEAVDAFDMQFEEKRELGEPGDDPKAPYHRQHRIATSVETLLAQLLEVNWDDYANEVETL